MNQAVFSSAMGPTGYNLYSGPPRPFLRPGQRAARVGWATPPSWLCVMEGEREDVVRKEGRERGEGEKKRKKKEKKPKRGGGEKGIQSIPGRRRKKIRRVEEEEAAPESRVATHGSSEEGEAGKEKHPKLSFL